MALFETTPPCATSRTLSFTKSQPRNLLSIAKLNNARREHGWLIVIEYVLPKSLLALMVVST